MSVDISVSITEDIVDIIATPTVNIVNVTNSASIDPSLYDLSEFTNTSPNPFVRTSGLSSYVPTSRTLTINGTTQDLSANRTFTVSTGITIGTTAITSGTVGRVLFEGTGNVVQESANLFWDNTNGRLGIGTSSPARALDILSSGDVLTGLKTSSATGVSSHVVLNDINSSSEFGVWGSTRSTFGAIGSNNAYIYSSVDFAITSLTNIKFGTGASLAERMRIVSGNGNVLINTTTDAGYRLDVNGTSRVSSNISGIYDGLQVRNSAGASNAQARIKFDNDITPTQTSTGGVVFYTSSVFSGFPSSSFGLWNYNSNGVIAFATNSTERLRIFSTGNVGINTTTDAGFRLDVNGTARVSNNGAVNVATFTGSDGSTIIDRYGNFYSQGLNATSGINGTGVVGLRINKTDGNGKDWRFEQNRNLTDGSLELGVSPWTNNIMTLRSTGVIGINTNAPNASAQLEVASTTRGFLCPRMTTTQKNAIATPAEGLQVWDTTLKLMFVYNGTTWISL